MTKVDGTSLFFPVILVACNFPCPYPSQSALSFPLLAVNSTSLSPFPQSIVFSLLLLPSSTSISIPSSRSILCFFPPLFPFSPLHHLPNFDLSSFCRLCLPRFVVDPWEGAQSFSSGVRITTFFNPCWSFPFVFSLVGNVARGISLPACFLGFVVAVVLLVMRR